MSTYQREALARSAQAVPTLRLLRVTLFLELIGAERAPIYRAELERRGL